ncbi:MAG: sensor domain-containing diguanylate cyclase [Myxococcota bacterium]
MKNTPKFAENIFDNLYEAVALADIEHRITYWNKAAEQITGFSADEVIGTICGEKALLHINERGENLCGGAFCPITLALADDRLQEVNIFILHKNGYRLPVQVRVAPLKDAMGDIVGVMEVFREDISKEGLLQRVEVLEKLAMLDSLTQIGNRAYLAASISSRLEALHDYGFPFACLFIDIDRFKGVNDSFGHEVGDKVLKMVAQTVLNNVRSFDTVGRWGGEEFIVIAPNINSLPVLLSFATKLRTLIEKSVLMEAEKEIGVTVSIGATLAQRNDSLDSLLRRADKLMYKSKQEGRNRVSIQSSDDIITAREES